jgi:hypothetical protein
MYLRIWKRPSASVWLVALATMVSSVPHFAYSQVSKGSQILLNRGVQIQGLSTPDNYLHLDTYSNANYTTLAWSGDASGNAGLISDFEGPLPGFPWARWVSDPTNMPGLGSGVTGNGSPFSRTNEIPYFSQLVSLQLADEWDLNTGSIRTNLINWFKSVQTNWPNTILYHNNFGGQVGDSQLADFYTQAHPDMLCFDTYPWQSQWDGSATDHIGAVISGPPTGWYGDLRRYRAHADGAGIPLGMYRQTFHSVEDYDTRVYRDPSKSELRLQTSAGLAFNVKYFSDFTYNPSSGSLFTKTFNGSGDAQTNANGLYAEITDANKRALNLGRALTGLRPVYDLHNPIASNYPNGFPPGPASDNPNFPPGITTSIEFLRGKYLSGGVTNFNALPNSFQAAPGASSNPAAPGVSFTWWESTKNDPYLRGWAVTNTAGVKNNNLMGDVILSWFRLLDENLDGTAYTNEIYMMVVNGLTATDGTAADCRQHIVLNFIDNPATTSLLVLDATTGTIVTNNVPLNQATGRRLAAFDLDGGDAVLFKFNTGAPFVGFIPPTQARLAAQKQGTNFVLNVQGALGARYRVQTSPSLPALEWTDLTNVVMTTSPLVLTDAPPATARFYRAVGVR